MSSLLHGRKRNTAPTARKSRFSYWTRAASRRTTGVASNKGDFGLTTGSRPRESGAAQNRYQAAAICGFLLLAVTLVFGQTLRHEFVNYDDNVYVYETPLVSHGVTAQGIAWAFTNSHGDNWVR